jgi:DNA-binding MarR family transcriptional regulator
MGSHQQYEHQILTAIESGGSHSQRTLASSVGIALGLTNLLLARLVRKGWVRIVRIQPNRFRYLLTPAGVAEKARMSRLYLQESVRFYTSARDRIRESLADAGGPDSRIVFYGTGEVAEIAFVCLQETELKLVGAVGDTARGHFFGLPVFADGDVRDGFVGGTEFDRLVVTLFEDRQGTEARLHELGVSPSRVHWL